MDGLFGITFRVISGRNTQTGNPFVGSEGDRVIVSVDTLAGVHVVDAHRRLGWQAHHLLHVDRFRLPMTVGGARFMLCTDAAAEGINLQLEE